MRPRVVNLVIIGFLALARLTLARQASARVNCEGFEGIKPSQMLLSIWGQPPKGGEFTIIDLKCGEKIEVFGGSSEPGWWRACAGGKNPHKLTRFADEAG